MIVDGQITRAQAFKTMNPINLNGYATTLIIYTAISKHDVLSNQSEEEYSKILENINTLQMIILL